MHMTEQGRMYMAHIPPFLLQACLSTDMCEPNYQKKN